MLIFFLLLKRNGLAGKLLTWPLAGSITVTSAPEPLGRQKPGCVNCKQLVSRHDKQVL